MDSGNVVGVVSAEGAGDEGDFRGNVYPVTKAEVVRVDVKIVDDGMRLRSNRAIAVTFGPEDALTVDVGSFRNKHFRDRADDFVNTLLLRLAGLQAGQ